MGIPGALDWGARRDACDKAGAGDWVGYDTAGSFRMVRVRPTRVRRKSPTAAAAGSTGATMVIAIGAARIEVRSDFDRALLAQVVEALGGAS